MKRRPKAREMPGFANSEEEIQIDIAGKEDTEEKGGAFVITAGEANERDSGEGEDGGAKEEKTMN